MTDKAFEQRLQTSAIKQHLADVEKRFGKIPDPVARAVDEAYAQRLRHVRRATRD